jgi:hypothetical protein
MYIYKIIVQHFSQKDEHASIETFVLAESDEAVYQWVDKEKCYGTYADRTEEDGLMDVYDDDYTVVGQETFKEKMLRIGGEYFDGDYEPVDLYYGVTIYGWEKMESNLFDVEVSALKKLGILVDLEALTRNNNDKD